MEDTSLPSSTTFNALIEMMAEKLYPKNWDILNTELADWNVQYGNVTYFTNYLTVDVTASHQVVLNGESANVPAGTYQYEITVNTSGQSAKIAYSINGVATDIANFASATISGTVTLPANANLLFINGASGSSRTFTVNKFKQIG